VSCDTSDLGTVRDRAKVGYQFYKVGRS